jgi:hypothetical protein
MLGREIKGRPDDADNGYMNLQHGAGYYNHPIRPEDYFYYHAVTTGTWSSPSNNDLWRYQYDLLPDKFYYKLLDKSGAFYFQRDMTAANPGTPKIVTHPYEPDSIAYSTTSGTIYGKILDFTLTDDRGFTYYFGRSADKSRRADDCQSQLTSRDTRTAWKIMEIVSPVRKDKVTFNYYPFSNVTQQSILNVNNDFVATEEWMDKEYSHYQTNKRPCVTSLITTLWKYIPKTFLLFHLPIQATKIYFYTQLLR